MIIIALLLSKKFVPVLTHTKKIWEFMFLNIACQLHKFPNLKKVVNLGFPGGSVVENGRSPGEGNGNPLQYSCLGNPMDREAWWVTVHGVAKELDTTYWPNSNSIILKKKIVEKIFANLISWRGILSFPGGSVVKNLPAMQETWVQSLGWEDLLAKEMATHSSILAWRIPWTEEPGWLQSVGLQRDMTEQLTY